MKKIFKQVLGIAALLSMLFTASIDVSAQPKKPGGGRAAKPAAPANRPSPSGGNRSAQSSVNRPAQTSASTKSVADRNNRDRSISNSNKGGISDNRNNNRNTNVSGNNVNINVDNSKDIKINNNRNTVVRHNTYRPPYSRPPYVYGGYRYRCYYPYYYHPYRPFYWGPMWHPWGFFVTTLAVTAIIVSFADADLPPNIQHNLPFAFYGVGQPSGFTADEYYYDSGVFYLKEGGGYTVVAAPVGGIIKSLPDGYETVSLDDAGTVKNYYYGGTFYEKVSKGYKVVPPTSGVVVEHLPEGGEEVKMGDVTYVKMGETYFQPIQQNGKNMYEVANVEQDK